MIGLSELSHKNMLSLLMVLDFGNLSAGIVKIELFEGNVIAPKSVLSVLYAHKSAICGKGTL